MSTSLEKASFFMIMDLITILSLNLLSTSYNAKTNLVEEVLKEEYKGTELLDLHLNLGITIYLLKTFSSNFPIMLPAGR